MRARDIPPLAFAALLIGGTVTMAWLARHARFPGPEAALLTLASFIWVTVWIWRDTATRRRQEWYQKYKGVKVLSYSAREQVALERLRRDAEIAEEDRIGREIAPIEEMA